jgi:hypothetical protein
MSHIHTKNRNGYIISNASTLPTLGIPNGSLATTATVFLVANTGTGLVADTGGNGISITKNGTVTTNNTQTAFVPSTSAYLPGGGINNLYMTSSVFAVGTGDFTMETFIRILSYNTGNVICDTLNQGGAGGRANSFILEVLSSGYLGVFNNGSIIVQSPAASITLNTWHHVAFCRISGVSSLYINGNQVAQTTSFATTNFSTGYANIGRVADSTSNTAYCLSGYISNWRFVKGIGIYNASTYTIPTANLSVPTAGINWTNSQYGIWSQA